MKLLHICASLSMDNEEQPAPWHPLSNPTKKGSDYMIREQSLSGAVYRGLSIIQMSP